MHPHVKKTKNLRQRKRKANEMTRLLELVQKQQNGTLTGQEQRTLDKVSLVSTVVDDLLKQGYQRIGLVGPHCSAKSLVSLKVTDRKVVHTDDYMDMEWGEDSKQVVVDHNDDQPLFIEGCKLPNAIRKGLRLDALVIIDASLKSQSEMKQGHRSQQKSITTVLEKCFKLGCLDNVCVVHV